MSFYINLRNGNQHTISGFLNAQEAIDYAINLFGRYQVLSIINENTGEKILCSNNTE